MLSKYKRHTEPNRMGVQVEDKTIKILNVHNKERLLKASKEKGEVTYKGRLIRIIVSQQTLKERHGLMFYKFLNDHRCQLLYPTKLSIITGRESKILHN